MTSSLLDFLRGSNLLFATDVVAEPNSGLNVTLCGDAHLLNFGVFTSPEGRRIFDVDDFDAATIGPFEWDVKRLALSAVAAADQIGVTPKRWRRLALAAAGSYRRGARELSQLGVLDAWYSLFDVRSRLSDVRGAFSNELTDEICDVLTDDMNAATRSYGSLVRTGDEGPQFEAHPPRLIPVREMSPPLCADVGIVDPSELLARYRKSLPAERQPLLDQFVAVDMALKVVGVASIGTRCLVVLLTGRDQSDHFVLQVKEAMASALNVVRNQVPATSDAERVVRAQRLLQSTPDPLLGWWTNDPITTRGFYVRQYSHGRATIELGQLDEERLSAYVSACGWALARAHSRSGRVKEITDYLGKSEKFDDAIAEHALATHERLKVDWSAFVSSVKP